MNKNISSIIDSLKGKSVSSYGTVAESKQVDEDEWKTMHGAHILVDDKGGIKAGGPESMRKEASKEEIKKGVEDANAKSKSSKKKGGLGKGLESQGTPKKSDGVDKVIKKSEGESKKEVKNVPYSEAHKQENLDHLHKNSDTAKKYGLFKESDNPYGVKNVVDVDKEAAAKLLDDVEAKNDRHEPISDDEKECLKALCMAGTTLGKGKVFSQEDKDYIKQAILGM